MTLRRFTLVTDGPRDRILPHVIRWTLDECHRTSHHDVAFDGGEWWDPRPGPDPTADLAGRMKQALHAFPCDLLFVHRDAERESPAKRVQEIQQAATRVAGVPPRVCVIPVRMTEAWFLHDEGALRTAAGNPNGRMPLDLPRASDWEGIDAKSALHEALVKASGRTGRRLKQFDLSAAVFRLAEIVPHFASSSPSACSKTT